jgi:sugar phosphate isomerase/epimerase
MKIPARDLLVQVRYKDLIKYAGLLTLFRIGCEVFISEEVLNSCREDEVRRLAAAFNARDIPIYIHGPVINPSDTDAGAIKALYGKVFELGVKFGSKVVVTHLEYNHKKSPQLAAWIEENAPLWRDVRLLASRYSVAVLLENHYDHTADAIVGMMEKVGADNLKACFDIGHFHAFGHKGMAELLDSYPPGSIEEVHLSDNRGDEDAHLALGDGTIDFGSFFGHLEARGIRPVFVVEARSLWRVLKGIWYLKKKGFL